MSSSSSNSSSSAVASWYCWYSETKSLVGVDQVERKCGDVVDAFHIVVQLLELGQCRGVEHAE